MIHPSGDDLVNRTSTALQHWTITFKGKNAHSSNPQNGVNALSAVIKTFENIDHLRALMPLTANVHGIITEGGTAANIITDRATAEFTARAKDLASLNAVGEYIERAVRAAEVLTDATAEVRRDPCYAEMKSNRAISAEFKANMAELGVTMKEAANDGKYGSSDIGNVSQAMPTIHAYLNICSSYTAHHAGFTADCVTDFAHDAAVKGAKGLAMTGFDIMTGAKLREKIVNEFNGR
jgi:metal-dependent amidase/aminoacylase/carboxypeptidase family protein